MQLKITTDYAIRIVLYLATQKNRIVSSAEIAQAMEIPRKYLIQIGSGLKEAGIIEIYAGRNGGYRLANAPEQISMYDIVLVTEDTAKVNRCLEDDAYCNRFATMHCPLRRYYNALQMVLEHFLRRLTIADLLREPAAQREVLRKIIPFQQLQREL